MKLRDAVTGAARIFEHLMGTYDNPPPSTTDDALVALAERYKIQIITDFGADEENFSFRPLDKAQLKNAADLLVTELSIYTPDVIHASKLERIVLCSELKGGEDTVSGLTDVGFLLVDTIFINIDGIKKCWEHARRTVHHELFHCMDYFDDGYLDFDWRKLNSPDFTYWHMNNLTVKASQQEGFLEDYCQKSEWEDKAVIYSYMIVNNAELLERCETDSLLAQKVERMKVLLGKISPAYNDEFWSRMHELSSAHSGRNFSAKSNSKPILLDGVSVVEAAQEEDEKDEAAAKSYSAITITYEKADGKPSWLVSVESRDSSSHHFYTYNKLVQFLRKQGLDNIPQKEEFLEGPLTLTL